MSKEYRIVDNAALPSDADVARYADFGKLVYNYQRMTKPLYKRPLYKDPKVFLVILLVVLLAVLISRTVNDEQPGSGDRPVPEEVP